LESIDDDDLKEIEGQVVNYDKLMLKDTDFHKYYDLDEEKQDFKLKNGHRKLLNGIREKNSLKGSEFFVSLMSTNPVVAITQMNALAVPPEKEIEYEINKIQALIKTIIAEQFELGNNDIESILRIMVKITSSRL
jgi:hypothetical protein